MISKNNLISKIYLIIFRIKIKINKNHLIKLMIKLFQKRKMMNKEKVTKKENLIKKSFFKIL
jgi:hypothetical protein